MSQTSTVEKFNAEQIESIIDRVVPLVAAEEDYPFFRAVLSIKADSCKSSTEFTVFIEKLLKGNTET